MLKGEAKTDGVELRNEPGGRRSHQWRFGSGSRSRHGKRVNADSEEDTARPVHQMLARNTDFPAKLIKNRFNAMQHKACPKGGIVQAKYRSRFSRVPNITPTILRFFLATKPLNDRFDRFQPLRQTFSLLGQLREFPFEFGLSSRCYNAAHASRKSRLRPLS